LLEISSYACPDVTDAVFVDRVEDDACSGSEATFVIRPADGRTSDEWPLAVGNEGVGVIELPGGAYEIEEIDTSLTYIVTIEPGWTTLAILLRPLETESPDVPVEIVVLSCDSIEKADITESSDQPAAEDCEPGSASLTLQRTDTQRTSEPIEVDVTNAMTLALAPGEYSAVQESTQAQTTFVVAADQPPVLVLTQPSSVENDRTPEERRVAADDARSSSSRRGAGTTTASPDARVVVTKLPNTGSGADDGTGVFVLAAAAAVALSGAGALIFRKKG
jgi:hypothetical protein